VPRAGALAECEQKVAQYVALSDVDVGVEHLGHGVTVECSGDEQDPIGVESVARHLGFPAAPVCADLFDQPGLDLRRGAPSHVAFGHGVHHCIGAPLARAEMRIAFPALLRRFPHLALGVPFDTIAYRRSHIVYGVHSLPVIW